MRILGGLFLAGLLSIFPSRSAESSVIVNSLGSGTESFAVVNNLQYIAMGFETSSTGGELAGVTIRVRHYFAGAASFLFGRLYSTDANFLPTGSILLNLTAPPVSDTYSEVMFTSNTTFELLPNTKYAFVLGATNSAFLWDVRQGSTPTGTGSMPNQVASSGNSGSTWGNTSGYRAAGKVETVPEPSTLLLGLFSSTLFLFRRQSRVPVKI